MFNDPNVVTNVQFQPLFQRLTKTVDVVRKFGRDSGPKDISGETIEDR
jgi:hypothetical protein